MNPAVIRVRGSRARTSAPAASKKSRSTCAAPGSHERVHHEQSASVHVLVSGSPTSSHAASDGEPLNRSTAVRVQSWKLISVRGAPGVIDFQPSTYHCLPLNTPSSHAPS